MERLARSWKCPFPHRAKIWCVTVIVGGFGVEEQVLSRGASSSH